MGDRQDEYMRLVSLNTRLTSALEEVRAQMRALDRISSGRDYRIALRPDERAADPMSSSTLLDDIVVSNVAMFRAEQMSRDRWWVCCYLDADTHDSIVWTVEARKGAIQWTTRDFPNDGHIYEHDLPRSAASEVEQ